MEHKDRGHWLTTDDRNNPTINLQTTGLWREKRGVIGEVLKERAAGPKRERPGDNFGEDLERTV